MFAAHMIWPGCWQNVIAKCAKSANRQKRRVSKPVEEFLQIIENKWRRCMGIEPTEPAFRRTPLDLKSRPATRPDSPPRRTHCSSPLRQLDRNYSLLATLGFIRV